MTLMLLIGSRRCQPTVKRVMAGCGHRAASSGINLTLLTVLSMPDVSANSETGRKGGLGTALRRGTVHNCL